MEVNWKSTISCAKVCHTLLGGELEVDWEFIGRQVEVTGSPKLTESRFEVDEKFTCRWLEVERKSIRSWLEVEHNMVRRSATTWYEFGQRSESQS